LQAFTPFDRHRKLDMCSADNRRNFKVECICGKRRYCYAGDDRPQFDRFNSYELMRHDKDIRVEEGQKGFHVASGSTSARGESLYLRVSLLIAFIGLLLIKL